jgi:fucose 4-O-acetylase-like acetyltransferase
MKRNFAFLGFVIKLLLVLGWTSLIGGVFSFVVILFFSKQSPVITAATFREAVNSATWGLLAFVFFCGWAEGLKVLLAIEENTRKM